jgi:hypothetical protein
MNTPVERPLRTLTGPSPALTAQKRPMRSKYGLASGKIAAKR